MGWLVPAPETEKPIAYKFALITPDGEIFDVFETSEGNWRRDDVVIGHNNTHFRVLSVIPEALPAEFVDEPVYGVLEVEALAEQALTGARRSHRTPTSDRQPGRPCLRPVMLLCLSSRDWRSVFE